VTLATSANCDTVAINDGKKSADIVGSDFKSKSPYLNG
jgi:hypothetical protein